MKSVFLNLVLIGFTTLGFCQTTTDGGNDNNVLKMEELPEVVIKNAGKDFSVYFPDKTGDASVQQLEEKFIAYNLGKDYAGYDNYLVIMESNSGTLTATYNENGKLVHVIETYKDIRLPSAVIYTVYKNYPEWEIVNDKYTYSQVDGKVDKKEYSVKLKKNNEVVKLLIKSDGEIVSR